MRIDHILVPIDGSDISERVLKTAIMLASHLETKKLTLVQVVDNQYNAIPYDGLYYDEEIRRGDIDEAYANLGTLKNKFKDEIDLEIETEVITGDAGTILADVYPEENNVDLIVMGATGKGMVERVLIGSVANYVVKHSKVDTYLVR